MTNKKNLISLLCILVFASTPFLFDTKAYTEENTHHSGTKRGIPGEVEDAMKVLLLNGGEHPSPLPKPVSDALDIVVRFDHPHHILTKYYEDDTTVTSHEFRKCKLHWIFRGDPNGKGSNQFYIKTDQE